MYNDRHAHRVAIMFCRQGFENSVLFALTLRVFPEKNAFSIASM